MLFDNSFLIQYLLRLDWIRLFSFIIFVNVEKYPVYIYLFIHLSTGLIYIYRERDFKLCRSYIIYLSLVSLTSIPPRGMAPCLVDCFTRTNWKSSAKSSSNVWARYFRLNDRFQVCTGRARLIISLKPKPIIQSSQQSNS